MGLRWMAALEQIVDNTVIMIIISGQSRIYAAKTVREQRVDDSLKQNRQSNIKFFKWLVWNYEFAPNFRQNVEVD